MVNMTDKPSGDVFRVQVPFAARHTSFGWGDREHVVWDMEEGTRSIGLEISKGARGITALDEDGKTHRLAHDSFEYRHNGRSHRTVDLDRIVPVDALRKAALKPGQQWITVHPRGRDEKGTPVLIGAEPDGTWRVIAGAGGKLTHLRLTGIKSKAEYKAQAKERHAEKREAEKERKAAQPPEARKKEKVAKEDIKARKLLAERQFIHKVREKTGGVSEDIEEEKLAGLSKGATNLIMTRHHKRQLREAVERKDVIARALVQEEVAQATEHAKVRRRVEEDPVLERHAREMATMELTLKTHEDEERRVERRMKQTRQTAGETRVGEKAAKNIASAIDGAADPKNKLEQLGGRDDDPKGAMLRVSLLASEEVRRRGLQALDDAKGSLAKAEDAKGDDRDDLLREASRKMRRYEIQTRRADRLEDIEGNPDEGGESGAARALMYADLLGGIATSAAAAKRMGLTDTERVPLKEAEVAEMLDVLQDAQALRKAHTEFNRMNKAVEAGDYDQSRRAFQIDVGEAADKVKLSITEQTQRELTERLLGVANPRTLAHLQAVGHGHYNGVADVALGITGQRYVDRPTTDAIGLTNTSLLLRHAMEADGHDIGAATTALEEQHVADVERLSAEALAKADAYIPGLSTTVEDVGDIEQALVQLDVHEVDIEDAQRAVGAALGRLEATAALGETFRRSLPAAMTIKAGTAGLDNTLQWLHAIGLQPGDYRIDYKERQVSIPRTSWDKLTERVPREELDRRQLVNAIKAGKHDEEGWLPEGIVRREASTFNASVPDAPRLFHGLDLSGPDVPGALADHVGSRLAEGEPPPAILSDLLAPANVDAAPDRDAYIAHVRELFPLAKEGKAVKYGEFRDHFDGLSRRFMESKYGSETGAFHAQDLQMEDPNTREAMFRTLAANPTTKYAFTPTADLDHEGRRALRDRFYDRMGIDPKKRVDEAAFQQKMADLGAEPDPTKGTLALFGGGGPSPEWRDWARERDAILTAHPRAGFDEAMRTLGDPPDSGPERQEYDERAEAVKQTAARAPTAWQRYVDAHGSLELAQQALQDELRSEFVEDFREHHGQLTGRGLRLGVQEITNRERHVKATATPKEREEMLRDAQALQARLRLRVQGRFAAEGAGAVKQKFTEFLEQDTIAKQNQGALFTARQIEKERKLPEPKAGERWSLGERAEDQLASLMSQVGPQFEPGKPVRLFGDLNMDGARIHQQRVVKAMETSGGRFGGWLGTGSGKSLVSIGSFTSAKARGETQRGLFLTPLSVEQQFGGEMLRFTEPGAYKWQTGSGRSHDDRVAMLKSADLDMAVMTHESFRETAMRVMAEHFDRTPKQMQSDLASVNASTRAQWMRSAFDAAGIPRMFTYFDEGHKATTRGAGPPSALHLITSAATHPTNATHMLMGTATPHKNDEAEMYSMAAMLDPEKYSDRHSFMQAFGADIEHNPDAIRRELSHLTYSARVDPEGVDRLTSDNPRIVEGRKVSHGGSIRLDGEHKALVDRVGDLYERARSARQKGQVDVAAVRELSPGRFEGRPEGEHRAIAENLQRSLGIIRESAMRRAINQAPPEINQKLQQMADVVEHDIKNGTWTDRKGQEQAGRASIVFTDSAREARMIHDHLESRGLRSALYTGSHTSKERERVRRGFNPEVGEADFDVVVATSAAEAGINMQRAKVVHHYDVPDTQKSWTQRAGRAYRQGQEGDVEVHNWHTDVDYEQTALRRLRRKTGLASVFETPLGSMDETGIAGAYQRALEQKHQSREVA